MDQPTFPTDQAGRSRLRTYDPFVRAAGRHLARVRLDAGVQLQALASRIGSQHSSLSRVETGQYKSVGELMRKAVEGLGADYDAFERQVFESLPSTERAAFAGYEPGPIKRGPRVRTGGVPVSASSAAAGARTAADVLATAEQLAAALEASGAQVTLTEFVDLLRGAVLDDALDAVLRAIDLVVRKAGIG